DQLIRIGPGLIKDSACQANDAAFRVQYPKKVENMTKDLFRIWVKRDFCRNRLGRLKICCHKEALNSRNISLSTRETHSFKLFICHIKLYENDTISLYANYHKISVKLHKYEY